MEGMYLGTVLLFAGNYAPKYCMDCYGQLLSIQHNGALFSILGTMYGGDGVTTFALPDLRGRVPLGVNHDYPSTGRPIVQEGEIGGTRGISLSVDQLPAHNHGATLSGLTGNLTNVTATLQASQDAPNSSTPQTKSYLAQSTDGNTDYPIYNGGTGNLVDLGGLTVSGSASFSGGAVTVANTGTSALIDITPPYIGMHYVICVTGIYPQRPH